MPAASFSGRRLLHNYSFLRHRVPVTFAVQPPVKPGDRHVASGLSRRACSRRAAENPRSHSVWMRSNDDEDVRSWHHQIMPPVLTIAITDTCGCRRNFQAHRASLDCGAGCLDLQAGSPCYCRKFDDATVKIFDGAGETMLVLHNGTASLTATALHILCETFREEACGDRPANLTILPAGRPETHENTPAKNKQNHII